MIGTVKKGKNGKIILGVIPVLMICILTLVGIYQILRISGRETINQNISTETNRMDSKEGIEESEGAELIWYHGKKYRYNENLTTVLFMGIDQRSKVIEKYEDVSGESGQADTIFLLVMDQEREKLHAIGISRDTITKIKIFDYLGNYVEDSENHLGLAYCFGDGRETSCKYMVDAVSNLFYGIPINAYVAINLEAVVKLNDAVGGVPVTVLDDLTLVNKKLTKGASLTLMGEEAWTYITFRDTEVLDSNSSRMLRQKQYMLSFMQKAAEKVKKDVTLPATLYNSLTEQMVTNISLNEVVYLVPKVLGMSMNEDNITMLKGKAVQGRVYDEIYVDDDALYELILDVFYIEEM